jgi:hypothetical protein
MQACLGFRPLEALLLKVRVMLPFSGGTISGVVLNASGVTISGGTIFAITDLAVADGGTGASTASGARANLGLRHWKQRTGI